MTDDTIYDALANEMYTSGKLFRMLSIGGYGGLIHHFFSVCLVQW